MLPVYNGRGMSTTSGAVQSKRVSALVWLLALAIVINALDRGNFPTAAPLIKDALRLSNTQIGVLISAFFWTYVPGHFLSGWLSERITAHRTLAIGLALWSVATLCTGFASAFAVILLLRLLLGLGESASFPASSKLLAQHVPSQWLASANAAVGAGLMLGNGFGTLLGGLLVARLGWRALFLLFGTLSLLWLYPWLRLHLAQPVSPGGKLASTLTRQVSFREICAKRELWGTTIGHFCNNYPYFLVLSWLPLYLVKQQGYSINAMAWIGGSVFLLSAIFSVIGGRIADAWISRGSSINRVRKTMILVSAAIGLVCMIACAVGNPQIAVGALLLYSISNGFGAFSTFSIGQTLAGPQVAGKWMGIQNGIGGLAGVVGPLATGWLIDTTGDYRAAFLLAAAILILGIFCWSVVVRKVEPIRWQDLPDAPSPAFVSGVPQVTSTDVSGSE
jgi:MFS family permease